MAGSTKKRKASNTDFKRIKAKVGKKALKPANVTDTSFKAASVSVKNQAVAFSASQGTKLVSERGRSISELATQLNHPAAAVRTSAIRGIHNVVDSHSDFLKTHLSVLLPAIAKCCVDEDDDVRQLGLIALRKILQIEEESALTPFLALLTAYVNSALNSLDRSTRLDGGRAVEILSATLPSLMGSSSRQAELLLPAFVGLLTDYTKQRRPTETSKKRKKMDDLKEAGQFVTLQSLVALLRTIPGTSHDDRNVDSETPDLEFVPGGRTVNGLLVAGHEYRSVPPLQSIDQLASSMEGTLDGASSVKDASLSVSVATDIVSKLRDIFIELTQRSNTHGSRGSILLGAVDIEELSLLNEAIRLFWNAFCKDMFRQATDAKQVEVLRRVFTTLLSLLMELFPVWQQTSSVHVATQCALLNADVCATLMDIGGFLEADSKGLNWTKRVLGYLLPRLDSDASIPIQGEIIVDVLSRLLFLTHDSTEFTLTEKTRCKILDRLCGVFFVDELKPDAARLASSRRAVLLLVSVLKHEDFQLATERPFSISLKAAIKTLPLYLQAWRGDFLRESSRVLSALHDVSRRLDLESQSIQDIVEYLQHGLDLIFEAPKRSKHQKRSQRLPPILVLYSEEMQRVALGLLVMIRSLSETTVNGLSYICARSGTGDAEGSVSPMIADAVMYAVHSNRRSISMQAYLSFILSSIGIASFEESRKSTVASPKGNGDKSSATSSSTTEASGEDRGDHEQPSSGVQIDFEMLKASEASVHRAARSFALCGSAKVLSMIGSVLAEWLATMRPTSGLDPSQKAIRFRTASSICAMMLLDITSSSTTVDENDLSLIAIAPELASSLVTATCNLFTFCFSRDSGTYASVDAFDYLMQPVLALMKTDAMLIEAVFQQASGRMCDGETASTESSAYIDALLSIIRNTELAATLRTIPKALAKCCETFESAMIMISNNTLERQAVTLRTAVELLIGKTPENESS